MKCNLQNRNELIIDYLSGELSGEKAKAFEEHYFQCETCFKELQIAEDALNLIEREGPEAFAAHEHRQQNISQVTGSKVAFPHFSTRQRWGIAIGAMAAAAAICLIIISQLPNGSDSLRLSGPNFEPNPYLEEWITESTRSEGEKLEKVLSPEIGEKFKSEEVEFRWKMIEQTPLFLKILSNVEEEILTLKPEPSNFPMFMEKANPEVFKTSGLYYWRLEDKKEVLYVGKFYFLKEN